MAYEVEGVRPTGEPKKTCVRPTGEPKKTWQELSACE